MAGIHGHIIDGDTVTIGVTQELVNKLRLAMEVHPKRYQVAWVNDEKISVTSWCNVDFLFGRTCMERMWCDVLLMTIGHIILRLPWLFDEGFYKMVTPIHFYV